MKVSIKKITNMKNGITEFADTIFNNFIHLSKIPELEHNRNELHRLLSSHNTICFVAYINKIMIGYLVGENKRLNDGRFVFYISYIYIGQKYRGLKLGTKLMNLAYKLCENNGIAFIVLTYDVKDINVYKFYQKLGFVPDPILKNNTDHEVLILYI